MSFVCFTHNDMLPKFFPKNFNFSQSSGTCNFPKRLPHYWTFPRAKYVLSEIQVAHFVTKGCRTRCKNVGNGFYVWFKTCITVSSAFWQFFPLLEGSLTRNWPHIDWWVFFVAACFKVERVHFITKECYNLCKSAWIGVDTRFNLYVTVCSAFWHLFIL